jgi:uncharacterized protein
MEISVIKGDITEINTDAIVDPANSNITMGGGLSETIRRKGGDIIRQEAQKHVPVPVGKAVITTAGKLKTKYVIHAPTMKKPVERIDIKNVELATQAILHCCVENKIDSVAIPGLGAGAIVKEERKMYGFTTAAAKIMIKTIRKFKEEYPKKVILIGFNDRLYEAFKREIMDKDSIIEKTVEYVKKSLEGEGSGHDWWHTYRVWKMAIHIGKIENADLFVVQLAALLHDIADWKFHSGDVRVGSKLAREWLKKLGVDENTVSHVCEIIEESSFKGAGVKFKMKTKEGKIVQDADRLDAIGAIGIARTFAYGENIKREMYNPNIKPIMHKTFEEYRNSKGTTINHFYEKLFLLKDLMNTKTAKKIAEGRHEFMKQFLDRFFKEWEGKD